MGHGGKAAWWLGGYWSDHTHTGVIIYSAWSFSINSLFDYSWVLFRFQLHLNFIFKCEYEWKKNRVNKILAGDLCANLHYCENMATHMGTDPVNKSSSSIAAQIITCTENEGFCLFFHWFILIFWLFFKKSARSNMLSYTLLTSCE